MRFFRLNKNEFYYFDFLLNGVDKRQKNHIIFFKLIR